MTSILSSSISNRRCSFIRPRLRESFIARTSRKLRRADKDISVDTPKALNEFIENRVAAAYSIKKPLVFGEFGMGADGYHGTSQIDWYRAYLENAARNGAGGAMFWIITPDAQRPYGV